MFNEPTFGSLNTEIEIENEPRVSLSLKTL